MTLVLGVLSLLIASVNAATVLRYLLWRQGRTMLPLLGGLAGALALWWSPRWRGYWFFPLLVEPGSAPYGILLILALLRRSAMHVRPRRDHEHDTDNNTPDA